MLILIKIIPILCAIPDETYPAMNAGYEYGKPYEIVMGAEEFYTHPPDPETCEHVILGTLPPESKIC
jgi:hypothetical protein